MERESLLHSAPSDRWNAVLSIFFILGVGTLLPWNFFLNAKQYFMYKLRNTTIVGSESWLNSSFYVENQQSYESYLEVAAMVPALVFVLLNVAISRRVKVETRISMSLAIMSLMFLLTVIITTLDTDQWQQLFLILSLLSVAIMNAASGTLQGATCGLASYFPSKYMHALVTGMGLAGLLASIASVITLWLGSSPVQTGFAYFLIALVVMLSSLLIFFVLIRLDFYKFHVTTSRVHVTTVVSTSVNDCQSPQCHDDSHDGDDVSDVNVKTSDLAALSTVLKQIWIEALSVFLLCLVTLSCFPGVNSLIQSVSPPSTWSNVYFVPVMCFLLFNACDVTGRSLSGVFLWPKKSSRVLFLLLSVLRLIFIPVFLLSNIVISNRRLPSLLHTDAVPILAESLLGFSIGYLGTLLMMYGPQRVSIENSEVAGAAMSFFISLGLAAGAFCSIFLVKYVI